MYNLEHVTRTQSLYICNVLLLLYAYGINCTDFHVTFGLSASGK